VLVACICAIGVALKFRRYAISTLQGSISVLLRHCLRNSKYFVEVVSTAPEFSRSFFFFVLCFKPEGDKAEFGAFELGNLRHEA
jgi:hypothetical protein